MAMDMAGRRAGAENDLARWFNVILGVWLFISAFVWSHTTAQRTNTWICGVLAVAFALGAMRARATRFANTILAVWLFISAFVLPTTNRATVWNNALVAIAIFFISLSSTAERTIGRRVPPTPA